MLSFEFFNRDTIQIAKDLLGKIIRVKHQNIWLSAQIIETEAYCLDDKASHASLGFTQKRKALFMPAGTIYMYYARGGDSLNVSTKGEGNAVLIKSAYPFAKCSNKKMFTTMQKLNPAKNGSLRPIEKLCAGQTLLCKSLNLKVPAWDAKQFDENKFFIESVDYQPDEIIQVPRLGIPKGRDEHLLYRFVDSVFKKYVTKPYIAPHSRVKSRGGMRAKR